MIHEEFSPILIFCALCFEYSLSLLQNETPTGDRFLYPRIGQALIYVLMMRLKNLAEDNVFVPSTAIFIAPDLVSYRTCYC